MGPAPPVGATRPRMPVISPTAGAICITGADTRRAGVAEKSDSMATKKKVVDQWRTSISIAFEVISTFLLRDANPPDLSKKIEIADYSLQRPAGLGSTVTQGRRDTRVTTTDELRRR